jgi:AraC-like DNA-binding protein
MEGTTIETAFKPFEIEIQDLQKWEQRPHRHNFFELVFVEKGKGEQCINKFKYPYGEESLFLLPPLNCHSFEIYEPSKFIFIRFTGSFFVKSKTTNIDYSDWFRQLNYILTSYNRLPGEIVRSESDRRHLIAMVNGVVKEYFHNDKYSDCIIRSSLMSILNILTRNIESIFLNSSQKNTKGFSNILNYIHHHLYDKEKLKLSSLADHFNLSPTYFGEYFKKHSGESLQDYILKTKLKIAEAKILNTDQSLKETAFELGFTDSSHLSKMFKKFYHKSISDLRSKEAAFTQS